MSVTNDWTVDTSHYELATTLARARSQAQWERWMNNPTSVNLWITPWTTQNPNWEDGWLETELGGFFNGAATPASPQAYEVTQNAYLLYCWFKYKGYNNYCILALLTIIWNECNMGMGSWEGKLCPWSFTGSTNPSSLVDFLPTRTNETATYYGDNWHKNGTKIPESYTYPPTMDEVTHIQYSKLRPAGSWAAYKMWDIATYTDPETGLERVKLDAQGQPVFFIPDGDDQCVIGYGIVQWTNWTRLVKHAELAYPHYGGAHWQFNATLQLMTLEKERQIAMASTPAQQSQPTYDGEWRNTGAPNAYFTYNGTNYHYPYSCTWDNWAAGNHMTWVQTKCEELGITNQSTINVYKLLITFDIFCRCYLHAGSSYHDHFSTLSAQRTYFAGAITYWESNGFGDVRDIPRARDLPTTELDQYHLSQNELVCCFLNNPMTRRRQRRVCTILL